jgi:hypothetical protein
MELLHYLGIIPGWTYTSLGVMAKIVKLSSRGYQGNVVQRARIFLAVYPESRHMWSTNFTSYN